MSEETTLRETRLVSDGCGILSSFSRVGAGQEPLWELVFCPRADRKCLFNVDVSETGDIPRHLVEKA